MLINLVMLFLLSSGPFLQKHDPFDFNETLRALEDFNGIKHRSLYGLGWLVRAGVGIANPAGASDLKFAIFDQMKSVYPPAFVESVDVNIHPSWRRIVRRRTTDDRELMTVYAIAEKKDVRIFMVVAQRENAVVTQFKLSPDGFRRWLDNRCEGLTD